MITQAGGHIVHRSGKAKNACTSAVLDHFNIDRGSYHYAYNKDTVCGVLRRNGFSVRSRKSLFKVKYGVSVGQIRKTIKKIDGNPDNKYYMGVIGHAMVIDGSGATIVDTAPRKRDHRKVIHINIVIKNN